MSYLLAAEIEADESYFGGGRKGRGGRGVTGKVFVFGLFKPGGKVYTAIIPDAICGASMAMAIKRCDSSSEPGITSKSTCLHYPHPDFMST